MWFRNEEVCVGWIVGGGRRFRGARISGDEFAGIGCEPSFSRNADGQIGVDAGRRGIVRAGGPGRIAEEVILVGGVGNLRAFRSDIEVELKPA